MCGIFGVIYYHNQFGVHTQLQSNVQGMALHRMEGENWYVDHNIGLGILDATNLKIQPLRDATGRYLLVKTGEVYNHIQLQAELQALGYNSHTDTEVILNGYIAWGEKILDKINGKFAIAIYDKEKQTLFIARDRFGVQTLYYSVNGEGFVFASDIPTLLSTLPTKPKTNENAIFDYLVFNRTDQIEQTFFDGIYKLQHGCAMTLDIRHEYTQRTLPIIKWYDLKEQVKGQTIKADRDEFMRLFTHAIQMRLPKDLPWGVCLSGGLDSSAIASAVINILHEPDVYSFSAVYGKECSSDESRYIDCFEGIVPNMRFVHPNADTLYANLENYIRIHTEPTPTTSPFAQYCVMQEAKNYVKVTLDGQGADEALSGYEYIPGLYYKSLLVKFKWITLAKELVRYAKLHHSIRHIKYMFFFLLPARLRTKVRVAQKGYIQPDFAARHQHSVIADQLYGATSMQEMLIQHFETKLEHLLKWGNRNASAFAIESRQPFLDKDLVEYSLKMEDSAKVHNGYTKYILREVMQGIMPESVRTRVDKMGFSVPQDEWFRTEKFQKLIMDILTSDSFANRGFIIPEEAIKLYQKHLACEVNVSKDIWKWINLELWFREFID
jgi:asparagine synthase (glutamine-hydrolysing)